jgi:Putative Actinobacterial Holin-X, holin superfamily III
VADETTDAEVAPDEGEAGESLTDLLGQLGRDAAALAFYESRLTAARHEAELRRAGRDVVTALVAVTASLTAFVLGNTAALLALATVMDAWLAALLLTAAWAAVGVVLALMLLRRIRRAGAGESVPEARDRAEAAVRADLERLAPAITQEIALAAVPTADGIVDVGEDLIEGADDLVESMVEELPGAGVVNQVWDVVLAPGRFGIRIATTVLKRDER